jgi:hypothetical protein
MGAPAAPGYHSNYQQYGYDSYYQQPAAHPPPYSGVSRMVQFLHVAPMMVHTD